MAFWSSSREETSGDGVSQGVSRSLTYLLLRSEYVELYPKQSCFVNGGGLTSNTVHDAVCTNRIHVLRRSPEEASAKKRLACALPLHIPSSTRCLRLEV